MSPTQKLRNMFELLRYGGVHFDDLDDELDLIECALGLPVTTPNDDEYEGEGK